MYEPVKHPGDMIKRVARALETHNLDELMSFYAPDAILVRPDGSEARGLQEIRAEYETYIYRTIAMSADVRWVHEAGNIASVRGHFTIKFDTSRGDVIEISGDPVETLMRQPDGSWLYMIDRGNGAEPWENAETDN